MVNAHSGVRTRHDDGATRHERPSHIALKALFVPVCALIASVVGWETWRHTAPVSVILLVFGAWMLYAAAAEWIRPYRVIVDRDGMRISGGLLRRLSIPWDREEARRRYAEPETTTRGGPALFILAGREELGGRRNDPERIEERSSLTGPASVS